MPALVWDIAVEAGSYEPAYIELRHPPVGTAQGALIDLTAPSYSVSMVVATRADGAGTVLLTLPDTSLALRRTATGRVYFEPPSAMSAAWTFARGHHHMELTHPSGQTVRIAAGSFRVSGELVLTP